MPSTTLNSKGQITLPKIVRAYLGLRTGDLVDFVVSADGEVRVRAGSVDVSELRGLLHRSGRRSVSVETMHKAVRKAVRRS